MRHREHEDVIRRVAAEHGASVIAIGTAGSGHRVATIARAGSCRKLFFASTPGDWRAARNVAAEVRRLVRTM